MSKQKPWSEIVRKAADDRIARMSGCEESLVSRIRELEERLHERDLAVAALSQERDEAYDRGVREGMVLVRQQTDAWLDGRERTMALSCYTAALEAYEKDVERE